MSGYDVTYRAEGLDYDSRMLAMSWTLRDAAEMAAQGCVVSRVTYSADCPKCGGYGHTRHAPKGWRKNRPVPSGMIRREPCAVCDGTGVESTREVELAGEDGRIRS